VKRSADDQRHRYRTRVHHQHVLHGQRDERPERRPLVYAVYVASYFDRSSSA
jgi:hypothetical protein